MLYGVSGHDSFTFVVVSFLLASVALLAIYIPAEHLGVAVREDSDSHDAGD
jgi:hypothetical protein